MKMLMPAKYQIYAFQDDDDDPIDDVPSYAQWIEDIGNGRWNKYWIAEGASWSASFTQPPPTAL